jgi:hypothetical protein
MKEPAFHYVRKSYNIFYVKKNLSNKMVIFLLFIGFHIEQSMNKTIIKVSSNESLRNILSYRIFEFRKKLKIFSFATCLNDVLNFCI